MNVAHVPAGRQIPGRPEQDEAVDYEAITTGWRDGPERADRAQLVEMLIDAWATAYRRHWPDCELVEFRDRGAHYLFDLVGQRTVAAHTVVPDLVQPRDNSYQRGFPGPARSGRPVDKGHLVPRSAGGDFGPNIYPQDRALNRGWSPDGRRYRAMERQAAARPGTLFFGRLTFAAADDFPTWVELGYLRDAELVVERFRNRFEHGSPPPAQRERDRDLLDVELVSATTGQIGALGEETALVHLETEESATIVAAGDAGMPRRQGYAGVTARVVVVDLRSRLLQHFAVDDDGRVSGPLGRPTDCTASAMTALDRIRNHRGRL